MLTRDGMALKSTCVSRGGGRSGARSPRETGTICCWPLEAWGRLAFITLIFDNFIIGMGANQYLMGVRSVLM